MTTNGANARPVIALAMGDPAGISPELTARILALDEVRAAAHIIAIGDRRILDEGAKAAGLTLALESATLEGGSAAPGAGPGRLPACADPYVGAWRHSAAVARGSRRWLIGDKLHLVNLAEHWDPENVELNGRKPIVDLTMAAALSGTSLDPCVGRFLEFRVARNPSTPDQSEVRDTLIPNPDLSQIPVARVRNFVFGRDAARTTFDPDTSFGGPWGIGTDAGQMLAADYGRLSAAPR